MEWFKKNWLQVLTLLLVIALASEVYGMKSRNSFNEAVDLSKIILNRQNIENINDDIDELYYETNRNRREIQDILTNQSRIRSDIDDIQSDLIFNY